MLNPTQRSATSLIGWAVALFVVYQITVHFIPWLIALNRAASLF